MTEQERRGLKGKGAGLGWGHGGLDCSEYPDVQAKTDREDREQAEFEMAKTVIAEANNSLYGSQGYFLSASGGPADKHHLSRPIEEMKTYSRLQWRRAEMLKAALTAARDFVNEGSGFSGDLADLIDAALDMK